MSSEIPEFPTFDAWPDGWHEIDYYAAAMQCSREQVLRLCRKYSVPRKRLVAGVMLVNERHLVEMVGSDGEETEG